MNKYKCLIPSKNENVVWLKSIRDAYHYNSNRKLFLKNQITWVSQNISDQSYYYFPENNRYCANYSREDFIKISEQEVIKELGIKTAKELRINVKSYQIDYMLW